MNNAIKILIVGIALVFAADKGYCQESVTINGKVTRADHESGVISVETGSINKQMFAEAHLNADYIWMDLIKNGYIDGNGTVKTKFYALQKFIDMSLSSRLKSKRKVIYNMIQEALDNNGTLAFYIQLDSVILQGTHNIASVEIDVGDPVTVQYDNSNPDKNIIIKLVDNKESDE